jgi:hypothetical protein
MAESSVRTKLAELRSHFATFGHVDRSEEGQVVKAPGTWYGHDWLIETLPEVIDLVANGWIDGYVEGLAKGYAEGRLEESRKMQVEAIKTRFPALVTAAKIRAGCADDPGELRELMVEILEAADEESAWRLLFYRRH